MRHLLHAVLPSANCSYWLIRKQTPNRKPERTPARAVSEYVHTNSAARAESPATKFPSARICALQLSTASVLISYRSLTAANTPPTTTIDVVAIATHLLYTLNLDDMITLLA